MKKFLFSLKFILLGFLFAGLVNIVTRCSKDDELFDSVDKDLVKLEIDVEGAQKSSEEVEKLFVKSDLEALNSMKFDDANSPELNIAYTPEDLEIIGKAFKKREITFIGESVVEYTYTIEGENYTMVMGKDAEGNWKIIRF